MHPPPVTYAESAVPELRKLDAIFALRDQALEVAAAAALYEAEPDIAGDWRELGADLERVVMFCAHAAARSSP